ncbi:hypothetical protein IWW55_001024 [Coemansia sp. RSA 2706]|nr:hypothetical protein IWW55_001024 [Coemansia sp. RSA 2706]
MAITRVLASRVLAKCSYSDGACKCQAQQPIAGCFNNFPSDEAHTANSSFKAAKTCTTASAAQTNSSSYNAEDEYVNPAVLRPRRGGGGHGQPKARPSDTLTLFLANSAASTLTLLLLTAAWLALAI